jgi:predicted lipoprotein with Yx(FWY)xxD motif
MRACLAILVLALAVAGCGGDDNSAAPQDAGTAATETQMTGPETETGMTKERSPAELAKRPAGESGLRAAAQRARIVLKESEFGRVLFDANGQVVYVFEIDRPNRSNCTSADCVKAWPPVLTRDPPTAGAGVDAGRLGTIRRGDGKLQVTYNGRPLYFYEHEGPGEIRCHNVNLHGGLWWVVTPRGEPAD